MKGLKKFKKCFAVLLVLSIILSLTPTMAFAEIGDYAQIQDVDLGFHHGTSPNGGQNVTKNIGYTKKAYEWFVQIGENQWLLVTKIGETADGVPIFGENTDYVCPICGSTNWISYSNNSDILGGHFNGKNMQVAHVHTGAANLSGDVAFSKMKFVDADFEFATSADGFLFDLYSSDANGNISPGDGPINSEPLSIDAADDYGTISFHFSQEGGYLPGWYIFIERENPEWQIDSAYANGILFYLDIVGSTLVPNWPNGEPFSGVIINNYPILGDLTISATDSTVQDEVQYRDVEQRDVWDIVQRNVWDITQRDVWDITRRDVWDITQRDVWDITQRDVWDIVQRNVWDITQRDVWDITQRNVWDITQRDVWDITQRDVWDITQRDIWDITQRDVWQTFQGQVWDIMQREIQPYIRPVFEKDVSSESGTLVTWLENGSVPGGKFGNYMTWMEVDVAEASKPGGIDYTISDSSPSNNPIEYSYNIRIEGDKLFLSLDDRLISASVTAKLYDSIPSTHDPSGHTNLKNGQVLVVPLPAVKSDPNPAAPTAVAVKNGNDINVSVTYNGSVVKTFTGAYVKNGQETFEDDGYKVTVTYNGNGVNKVTLVSYPDLAAPGGEPSALETIYMFVHFDGAKWFTTGDYEFIKWESAGKDEGEYMVVGHGSNDQVLDGSSDYYKVGDGAGESKKVGDGAGEYKKVGDGAGEYKKVGDGAGEYKKVGDGAGEYKKVGDGASAYVKVGDGAGEYKKVGDGAGEYKKVGDGASAYVKVGDGAGEYKKVGDGASAYVKVGDGAGEYTKVDRELVSRTSVTVSTNTKTYTYEVIDDANAIVESGSIASGTPVTVTGLAAGTYSVRLYGNDKDETKPVLIPVGGSESVSFGEYIYTLEEKILSDAAVRRLTDNKITDVQLPDNRIADVQLPDNKIADVQLPDNKIADVHLPDNKIADVHLPDNKIADVQLPDKKIADVQLDNKIADVQLPDNKVADVQLADNKVADVQLADKKIADVQLADKKIADEKLPDNKVADVYLDVEVLDQEYLEDLILPAKPLCDDCDEVDPYHEHARRVN